MTETRSRLTWIGVGVLIGLAAALIGFGRTDGERPAPEGLTEVLPESASLPAVRTDLDCDLGVVVASRAVDVVAQTAGLVESVDVEVGDTVLSGAVMARLEVRLLEQDILAEKAALAAAHAEVARRRIAVELAEAESTRREQLANLVSQEEIARAAAELEEEKVLVVVAEAETDRLVARIQRLETILDQAVIRAPFDGLIAGRYLDPGAHAAIGTPILRLISDGDLRIRFAASPQREDLTVGRSVQVEIPERGIRLAATVEQVAPELDAPSRRVFAEARLDSPEARDSLRVGEVVWVTEPGDTCL